MIKNFTGKYAFLSNFHLSPTKLDNQLYASVEHAFQAAKTHDPQEREQIRFAPSARDSKNLGRKCTRRSDWHDIRLELMLELVRSKFELNPDLAERLLDTGDQDLQEGNTWNDHFWGVCEGEGENHLGRILMQVRGELRHAAGGTESSPSPCVLRAS